MIPAGEDTSRGEKLINDFIAKVRQFLPAAHTLNSNLYTVIVRVKNNTFIVAIAGEPGFTNDGVTCFADGFGKLIYFLFASNADSKMNEANALLHHIVFIGRNARHLHELKPGTVTKRKK